ncbi:tetratricopeptide repeat protein [Vulcanococcus sp.]|jgi:tetratricopeptide (TPR) repeat protein|uniref:tetratricopeptide repeat protein n=1 Tax=Vulcanococcus sp. TaxID=2856995 RepID=UPI0037D9E546
MDAFQPNPSPSVNPADALRAQLAEWLQPILTELDRAQQQQNWEQVERLCKQALQRDGENWALWQRLAQSHEERSDWVQAETLWRHLTQRFSSRPEPYLALAALKRRRGSPDAARVVLEEAERRVGESSALRQALGVIDDPWALGEAVPQLGPGASAADVARALQLGQGHLDAGRFAEAEAVLEQILQVKPQAGRVQLSLAQLRWRRGELDALIAQLAPLLGDPQRVVSLPERAPLSLLLAQAYLARQRWQEADALLEPLALGPEPGPALLLLRAEAAVGRGDDIAAQQLLQQTLALDSNLARAERLLGELSLRLGDWDAAIAALTRALALQPDQAEIAALLQQARQQQLWWAGETALQRADWPAAGAAYRRLLEQCDLRSDAESHAQALARLDLLASLEPAALVAEQPSGLDPAGPEARLIQFRDFLDQAERQLKRLGVFA